MAYRRPSRAYYLYNFIFFFLSVTVSRGLSGGGYKNMHTAVNRILFCINPKSNYLNDSCSATTPQLLRQLVVPL
jgi:hypothetical protein